MNAATITAAISRKSPFRRSPESPAPIAANVKGTIPSWLRGELVRTCPAVFETAGWRADHWFDALGMVYAFEVNGPDEVAFRSRLLACEAARDANDGKARMASFGTPLARSIWQRLFEPVPRVTDNANVNILKMGDDLVAMTESDKQIIVDPVTLGARGRVVYDDNVLRGGFMSAHPHFDFERQQVVNVATQLGSSATVSVYEHGASSRTRKIVGAWKNKRAPYIHAFGLTPKNAILIAHPFTTSPAALLWSNRAFINHFAWRPEEGTRLVVIDRATGEQREHITEPFFVFHTVNAFEREDGATVLDLLAYTDADVISALRVDALERQLPDLRPSLVRLTMRPGTERATYEKLSDVGFEFPSTSYRRTNGHDYQFVWGAADGPAAAASYTSSLVKIDITTGASTSYGDDDHVFGEPVFVARPGASAEDDGVIVSVGSHRTEDRSSLVIVDAATMSLVASAEVARSIPLGFHGSFVRA